jgi:hypothetical protein
MQALCLGFLLPQPPFDPDRRRTDRVSETESGPWDEVDRPPFEDPYREG